MQKIILASGSPRRKKLMETLGIDFEIISSNFEEIINPNLSIENNIKNLSYGKASDVAQNQTNSIVIGVDTVVVFQDKIIGKPKSIDEAKSFIKSFSGNNVDILTGLTIIDTSKNKSSTETVLSKVFFRVVEDTEIDSLLSKTKRADKAGGFGIQNLGCILIEKIEGDYNNIVGLPLTTLYLRLKEFGINIL